jgi:metal-responsive CopG/Arc/MetJ family transcriptional regulator
MEDKTMRATVTIDKQILDELVQESGHKNKASAVRELSRFILSRGKSRRSNP